MSIAFIVRPGMNRFQPHKLTQQENCGLSPIPRRQQSCDCTLEALLRRETGALVWCGTRKKRESLTMVFYAGDSSSIHNVQPFGF